MGNSEQTRANRAFKAKVFFALGIALFALAVYFVVLLPGQTLFSTDDNMGALAARKASLPSVMWSPWKTSPLLGQAIVVPPSWTNLLLWLMPVETFNDWIHAIDLGLASLFLALFLRRRGLSWSAIAIGVLTAFWFGANFTLTYAGHIGKFGLLMFAAGCLWQTECLAKTQRLGHALVAGGMMGGMFLEQADLALFFALPLGAYAVHAQLRENGFKPAVFLKIIAPIPVVALLLALNPVVSGYSNLGIKVDTNNRESAGEKWEYATQWSWPLEDTVDLIAPGYKGIRSGDGAGPYWGRMGQTAGWKETGQGIRNHRLESYYLGAIPLIMAAWAVGLLFGPRMIRRNARRDVFFWTGAVLITFLLALGKNFFLYKIFYQLPGVPSIRNPVKFMQFTQIGIAVLAAYGAHNLIRNGGRFQDLKSRSRRAKWFTIGTVGLLATFLFWTFALSAQEAKVAQKMAEAGWPFAPVIASNMGSALLKATSLIAVTVIIISLCFFRDKYWVARLGWVLMLVCMIDQFSLGKHYVKIMDVEAYTGENELVAQLKNTHERVVMIAPDSLYQNWSSFLFPTHGIEVFNAAQARLSEEYRNFLEVTFPPEQQGRLWRMAACRYVLGPTEHLQTLVAQPDLRDTLDVLFTFDVKPDETGALKLVPHEPTAPGPHLLARYSVPNIERYRMVYEWKVEDDEAVLKTLTSPHTGVVIAEGHEAGLPESRTNGSSMITVEYKTHNALRLKVETDAPGLLRLADKFHPHWEAKVNGESQPIRRCDYLCQAIWLDAGPHEVALQFNPPLTWLYVQIVGVVISLLGVGMVIIPRKTRR